MLRAMLLLLLALTETILTTGGELPGPPEATVAIRGDQIEAFGFAEVPGKSRLQAALALADANARAELLTAVRAGVAEAFKDVQTEDKQEVERTTAQVAQGVLPGLPGPQHGWRRLRRDGEVVLQVWSRLTAQRSAVEAALAKGVRPDVAKAAAALIKEKRK